MRMPMTRGLMAVPVLVCCTAATSAPLLDADVLVQAKVQPHSHFPVPKIKFEAPCEDLPDYHFEPEEVDIPDWEDIQNTLSVQHGGPHRSIWREQAWGDENNFKLADALNDIFVNGKNATRMEWLQYGFEAPTRQVFVQLNSTKEYVDAACKNFPEHHDPLDCQWQTEGNLLCASLDHAGANGLLGDLQELAAKLNLTVTFPYKVNTSLRSMLITRWKKQNWGQWSKCEVTSNWEHAKTQTVLGPDMKQAVDQTCLYMKEVRQNCDYYAYRGLWCQAVSVAAFEQLGAVKLALALDKVIPLTQDAYIIEASPAMSLLTDKVKLIVQDAHWLTREAYLMSGGAKFQMLKEMWFYNDVVVARAQEKCPGEAYMSECFWKECDYSLLQYAEKLGPYIAGPEPTWEYWWDVEDKLMVMYANFTFDWNMRQKVVTKWTENLGRVRTVRGNSHPRAFNEMEERILESPAFISMIERSCWPINHIRPNCWERTTHDILFMSILQVVVNKEGAQKTFDQMLHKLQE